MKYLSELISNQYESWTAGDLVGIDAGTGKGKTYFCIHILGSYAKSNGKKVLFLCNRKKLEKVTQRNCDEEFLCLDGTITVMTYQKLQYMLGQRIPIEHYDYIIADECHYFTSDSYNNYTDLAYNYLKERKDSVVIYMSATARKFFDELLRTGKIKADNYYYLERNYDHVTSFCFYHKNMLIDLVKDILTREKSSKIMIFCNSKQRMLELYKEFGEKAQYMCSNYTKDQALRQICDNNALHDDMFDGRILVCTSVLDNGIDIKDLDVKYIFTELFDVDLMVQALGRKRPISDVDKCSFFIMDYSDKRSIRGRSSYNMKCLKPATLFKTNKDAFKDIYKNDDRALFNSDIRNNPIFNFDNGKISINSMIYAKFRLDRQFLDKVEATSYKETVMSFLDKELLCKYVETPKKITRHNEVPVYLEPYENIKLFQKEKAEIIKLFKGHGINKKCTGVGTFNGVLQDDYPDYNYRFYDKDRNGKRLQDKRRALSKEKANPNRDKYYWVLTNIA